MEGVVLKVMEVGMDTLRWLRKNGEIIGCEENGIEYTVYAIIENKDQRLHQLYHKELEKGGQNGRDTKVMGSSTGKPERDT